MNAELERRLILKRLNEALERRDDWTVLKSKHHKIRRTDGLWVKLVDNWGGEEDYPSHVIHVGSDHHGVAQFVDHVTEDHPTRLLILQVCDLPNAARSRRPFLDLLGVAS